MCLYVCLFQNINKKPKTNRAYQFEKWKSERQNEKTLDKINRNSSSTQPNGNSFTRGVAVIAILFWLPKRTIWERVFSQMDNPLDMDMDGSFNRSLTNSQIYDGEFFEIVGSEGEILVVRYAKVAFSIWNLEQAFGLWFYGFAFFPSFFSCNICTPDGNDGQLLRTSVKSNGNILKHIKVRPQITKLTQAFFGSKIIFFSFRFCEQRRHLELLEKIKAAKSVKSRAPRNKRGQIMNMEDVKPFKKKMVSHPPLQLLNCLNFASFLTFFLFFHQRFKSK